MKYIVDMPDEWRQEQDPLGHYDCVNCPIPCDIRIGFPSRACHLAHAKKAVDAGWVDKKGASMVSTLNNKSYKLYAVEVE